jgi:hypothetical protein
MNDVKLLKSAMFMALFLFLPCGRTLQALPLTETTYTIPDGGVEFAFREEYVNVEKFYRKEHVELGFGVLSDLSIWFKFDYLHGGAFDMGQGQVGDIFFKLWHYIGDYFSNRMHLGLMVEFRFPTGENAYTSSKWRNLCLGNHEITIGPVAQFDLRDIVFFHANVFYTFRQERNEDFYGGFYINPVSEKTYTKLFGLNPFADDAFLSVDRLKNDYITLALAVNTRVMYPFIPYVELSTSFRLFRGSFKTSDLPIEGAGIDSFLLSAGIRYFFRRTIYLGLYVVVNPLMDLQPGYLTNTVGFDFSVQL